MVHGATEVDETDRQQRGRLAATWHGKASNCAGAVVFDSRDLLSEEDVIS